jgi:hypothetical protein
MIARMGCFLCALVVSSGVCAQDYGGEVKQ